jgi:hypothetical protein
MNSPTMIVAGTHPPIQIDLGTYALLRLELELEDYLSAAMRKRVALRRLKCQFSGFRPQAFL